MNGEIKIQSSRSYALRAWLTAAVFALVYTMLSFFAAYYFPDLLNEGRTPKLLRLGLFLLAGAVFLVFLLLSRRDGSVPAEWKGEAAALGKDAAFRILAAWFLWACLALGLAVREGYASFRFNSAYLFDQGINFLVIFPVGFFAARQRDRRLLTAAAILCFLAFLPYALGGMVFSLTHKPFVMLGRAIELWGEDRLRLGGHPNSGGFYGALAFTSGLYLLAQSNKAWLRPLLLLGEALIFYALLLTGSRGGIGTAAIGFLYFGLVLLTHRLPRSARRHPAVLSAVGAVVLLAALAGLAVFLQKVTGRALVTASPEDRAYLWSSAIRKITVDPHILLHGVSSVAVSSVIGSLFGYEAYSTHNQLLEVWCGQGTPALCLFIAFVILVGRRCLELSFLRREGESRGSWAAVLFVLTLFVNSMVEVILVDNLRTHGSVFCLAAGTVCGMITLRREEKRGRAGE